MSDVRCQMTLVSVMRSGVRRSDVGRYGGQDDGEVVMTAEGPKIPTRYTHRQLATMIGSKRETVTKAFTLLQQAGAIELKRRRIHVRDIETLRKVADQGLHAVPLA